MRALARKNIRKAGIMTRKKPMKITNICLCDYVLFAVVYYPTMPKARGLAQHGSPPGWLEEE